ncbi:MAG: small basic protein [Candidatus Omnitrophota bacterium]
MSQHPSLRSKVKGKQHRSVLKRFERVKTLKEKEKWNDGDSVFGLLKLKLLKFKLKKEKAVPKAEEGALAEGAAPAAAAAKTEGAAVKEGAKNTEKKK